MKNKFNKTAIVDEIPKQAQRIYCEPCMMQRPRPPHADDPHAPHARTVPAPSFEIYLQIQAVPTTLNAIFCVAYLAFDQRLGFGRDHQCWQAATILELANQGIFDLNLQTIQARIFPIWPNLLAICICTPKRQNTELVIVALIRY